MMKFYDSDLASDHPMDFHSDHEPPKDKIKDKKLLKKTELRRFHKILMRTGSALPKPAKYDEISYKILQIPDLEENEDTSYEKLIVTETFKLNLGLNDKDEWFDIALESMKKDEIALILIENLKYDDNKFKILDNNEYYYIQLLDWTTVIDLDANFNYMKKIHIKGKGLDRCELCDEVSFTYKILFMNETLWEKNYDQEIKLEILVNNPNEQEKLDANLLKIIKTMKLTEKCLCHVKLLAFESIANNTLLSSLIETKVALSNLPKANLFIDIQVEINNVIKIDDLFHDHCALKRLLRKGRSTSKPDSCSLMYFDMQIRADSQLIYDSWPLKPEKMKSQVFPLNFTEEEEEDFNFLINEVKPLCMYLDEFKFSKVLKTALKRIKKGEIAEVICDDLKLINKGIDLEALEQSEIHPKRVSYLIKMYNFSEGKNTFTMTLDEKIENAKRKKEIGLELIKKTQFKRALKSFENINSYFELGSFSKEDVELIKSWKLSSLLNTTLCQMKLNKWKELVLVANKILDFDERNCKAMYRKALALKELSEYDQAFETLNEFMKKYGAEMDENNRKELLTLYAIIEKLLISYKTKEKRMFTNMFKQDI